MNDEIRYRKRLHPNGNLLWDVLINGDRWGTLIREPSGWYEAVDLRGAYLGGSWTRKGAATYVLAYRDHRKAGAA